MQQQRAQDLSARAKVQGLRSVGCKRPAVRAPKDPRCGLLPCRAGDASALQAPTSSKAGRCSGMAAQQARVRLARAGGVWGGISGRRPLRREARAKSKVKSQVKVEGECEAVGRRIEAVDQPQRSARSVWLPCGLACHVAD
jgi:hypothetical protein